ncbi:RnfABCDGE type electron transport complex subunit C [Anaerorhabdus sp.]|uniref:RnfABCDGE type electron transport complex subunit C n=1 Tax=Anaerorhabdus sp. TaxID=1872524 RepID=UPI002FC595FC
MSFIIGPMRKHVNGHKELTSHNEVVNLSPNTVAIPLVSGAMTADLLVNEGDKVKVGTKIAQCNGNFTIPMFSPVSGTVKGVQQIMHSWLKPVDHLVIENDQQYTFEAAFTPLDFEKASREELIEFTMNAGIVGCGGAGFPTYVKYKFAKDIQLLIINAVECEPYITADYKVMKAHVEDLVLGTRALLKMSGAPKAKVAIKVTKKDFIPTLQEAFKPYSNIEVVAVPDVYPMGWERTLVYELTKKRYEKLPSECGCIVNNATTAVAMAQALREGKPIVEKIITVSGDGIKTPSNVKVPVGVSAKEVVEACGGYAAEDVLLIAGGPMMGKTITSDAFVIAPYSNALTVFINKPVEAIKCLRCGKCSDHCPAGLQPVRINNAAKVNNVALLEKLNYDACIECGMCSYICPSKIDVTEGIRKAKRYMALKKK